MSQAMVASLKQFNASLKAHTAALSQKDLLTLQRAISLELLSRVVLKTPVDTGRARGNWQLTVAGITTSEVENRDPDSVVADGQSELKNLKPFSFVAIQNNVPYIEELERGSSQQAPQGMLALSLEEVGSIFP